MSSWWFFPYHSLFQLSMIKIIRCTIFFYGGRVKIFYINTLVIYNWNTISVSTFENCDISLSYKAHDEFSIWKIWQLRKFVNRWLSLVLVNSLIQNSVKKFVVILVIELFFIETSHRGIWAKKKYSFEADWVLFSFFTTLAHHIQRDLKNIEMFNFYSKVLGETWRTWISK